MQQQQQQEWEWKFAWMVINCISRTLFLDCLGSHSSMYMKYPSPNKVNLFNYGRINPRP